MFFRCNRKYGRHSKSINTDKKVCGNCRGRLQLQESKVKRPLTPFAKYVKENYSTTKRKVEFENKENKVAHKDVMKCLSEQFAAVKLDKLKK